MNRLTTSHIRNARSDEGFGLILVIGFGLVISLFITVSITMGIRALQSSRTHVTFEQALGAAENGIDEALARVQKAYDTGGGVYNTPSPGDPTCNQSTIAAPTFSSASAEQSWAKSELLTLAPACVQHGGQGDYVFLKPTGAQAVYAMGWVPSYGATGAKMRYLKADYIFSPWKPTNAILTGGTLNMSGSVAVSAADGTPAGIHANGSINSVSSDQIAGPVTASGTFDGAATITGTGSDGTTNLSNSGSSTPLQTIPLIDPRFVYNTSVAANLNNWYDLCPDGSVDAGAVSGPCTGTNLSPPGQTFRGWSFAAGSGTTPGLWTMGLADSPYFGVYYAYQTDASIATPSYKQVWQGTVLAEAAPTGGTASTCGTLGGNIYWKNADIQNYLPGLIMMAGSSIYDSAHSNASDGIIAAADQIYATTSSQTITGAIVAGDACTGAPGSPNTDTVQGVTVLYDQTAEAPLESIIRTTQWLEYVG